MNDINHDSTSVQSYIGILQNIISRMATNSAACKTWCITIVSAIIVIIADKGKPDYIWISLIPIVLLFFLDSYYLGQERGFRDLYNKFIGKLNDNSIKKEDIFIIKPIAGFGEVFISTLKAVFSIAILPFYLLLIGMLLLIKFWVL